MNKGLLLSLFFIDTVLVFLGAIYLQIQRNWAYFSSIDTGVIIAFFVFTIIGSLALTALTLAWIINKS